MSFCNLNREPFAHTIFYSSESILVPEFIDSISWFLLVASAYIHYCARERRDVWRAVYTYIFNGIKRRVRYIGDKCERLDRGVAPDEDLPVIRFARDISLRSLLSSSGAFAETHFPFPRSDFVDCISGRVHSARSSHTLHSSSSRDRAE